MIKEERVIMEEKKTSTQYSLIAGILFAVAALWRVRLVVYGFSIWTLLWFLSYAATAVMFFLKKRDSYVVAPFALLAVLQFRTFVQGFSYGQYITYGYYDQFSFYIMLLYLLVVIAYVGILCLATVNFTSILQEYKEKINSLWFVPAVLVIVKIPLGIIGDVLSEIPFIFQYSPYYIRSSDIFTNIFIAVAFAVSAIWIAYPDGLPKKETTHQTVSNTGTSVQATNVVETTNEAYCSLVKHILLLLFTFGIWHCIWIYRMTRYTNAVQDEEPRNSTNKLLLCLFVPFYLIYWTYKTAQRVDKMAAAKGISSDMSTLCLILEIFVPIIPPVLLQDKMNNIVTAGDAQPVTVQNAPQKAAATLGTADELKTYKELLDSGVISQEEFDAKKKQLLGL